MGYLLIRGGGDLASGVAVRLHRAGFRVMIAELPNPLAVRRLVSFSEAIYAGQIKVEGILARRADSPAEAFELAQQGLIPVLIDPESAVLKDGHFSALIDARLLKRTAETQISLAPLVIGLGPGFTAGENCHAVIETNRGHTLGRVYWTGSANPDTGLPEGDPRRVLRAPTDGIVTGYAQIGDQIEANQLIATVDGENVFAPFKGILRGLIRPGVAIPKGLKIGDLDQRDEPSYCFMVSDKALSVGGGVLEALLSQPEIRAQLLNTSP